MTLRASVPAGDRRDQEERDRGEDERELGQQRAPIELATMGIAAVIVAALALDGRSTRREGIALVGLYVVAAVSFFAVGDR